MKLEELKELWDKDCAIDESKLSHESLSTPKLHSKYLGILIDTKQKYIKKKYEFTQIKRLKIRYYKGELTKQELEEYGWDQWQYNKPLKSEMNDILDADENLIKEKLKLEYLETVIYFLESVLNSIKNRGFDIKNAIEWNKYISGN